MPEENWEIVAEVYGEIQAELLRGLLEAQGIPVTLNQEGAGRAYGINVGSLGMVQIMVPSHHSAEARQVLDDYQSGKFSENGGDQPEEGSSA
jgi:hypothetical protein